MLFANNGAGGAKNREYFSRRAKHCIERKKKNTTVTINQALKKKLKKESIFCFVKMLE